MRIGAIAAWILVVALTPGSAAANGHGPVFGGATPTLGKHGWQFDQAWISRIGEGPFTDEHMLRSMISFGVTEDLQISGSLPITLESGLFMPRGRATAMMTSAREFEAMAAWRFQRRDAGAGARLESTVFAGGSLPLETYRPDGMRAAPSMHAAAATGYASRTHYFWLGGGYQHHTEREGSRMGDVVYYSVVYGYRPPALQLDYPKPDLRFFVEAVGERTARGKHHGFELLSSGGTAIFIGPTALLLYKAYGLEGGILFPAYQRTNGQPPEQFRFAVNLSYFFWLR
jgi:hypothetical protein